MKKINTIFKALLVLLVFAACDSERTLDFTENLVAPSEVSVSFAIAQDNSGLVTITPSGTAAVHFDIAFGDDTKNPVNIESGRSVAHTYTEGTYDVKVVAYNLKGIKTEATVKLTVSFFAPQNLAVTLANDVSITRQVNINATADFATTYEFYSGETGVTQPAATGKIGEEVKYQFKKAGTYKVKVIAKGGAIATTEYSVDFIVTEILVPLGPAPTQPNRNVSDYISVFSGKYTDLTNTNLNPNWQQTTKFSTFDLNGDKMIQYSALSYQGIQLGLSQNVAGMEFLHMDVWTADATELETFLISVSSGEKAVKKTLTKDNWTTIEIPISDYTSQGLAVTDIHQFKFVGSGTIFIDNLYFYKASSGPKFDDGLLENGDFEKGSDSWTIGAFSSSAKAVPVETQNGNTYYAVNVTKAGNPWDVNMSQKVTIEKGGTYTLTFDAWSDRSRGVITGIGLGADPWTNNTKTVGITSTRKTYTLTLSSTGFGDATSRVIFDLGKEVGVVNIDNVSLVKD